MHRKTTCKSKRVLGWIRFNPELVFMCSIVLVRFNPDIDRETLTQVGV